MFEKQKFILLLLATCSLAAEFNCGRNFDVVACKQKFVDTFNDKLKSLHLTAFNQLCQTYIDIASKVQKELPKDYLFYALNAQSIKDVTKDLELIKENIDDDEKLAEIQRDAIHHMEFTFEKGSADPELYRTICNKNNLRNSLANIVKEFTMNIGKLWSGMYKNLRANDLQTYAEYATINQTMEKFENFSAELNAKNNDDFKKAVKSMGIHFDIPFHNAILEVS